MSPPNGSTENAPDIASTNRDTGRFATTQWSVVLQAGQGSSPQAGAALESLCRSYWYPLYAYVRRNGYGPHDAQDLTQEFFARFLEKKYFSLADRRRGRFRTFLLSSLKNFLVNEWIKAGAKSAGADKKVFPWTRKWRRPDWPPNRGSAAAGRALRPRLGGTQSLCWSYVWSSEAVTGSAF